MIYEEHVLGNTGCLFLGGSCIPFYRISGKQWILLDSGPRCIRDSYKTGAGGIPAAE